MGHIAWPVTVVALCFLAKNQLRQIVESIAKRIGDRQSHVRIDKSGIEIKTLEEVNPELAKVESVHPNLNAEISTTDGKAANNFIDERNAIYKSNRGLFLVHVLEPTTDRTQEYDLFIYILPHKDTDITIVKKAEFFFGQYWGNELFLGTRVGNVIGVRTSAYGPFL